MPSSSTDFYDAPEPADETESGDTNKSLDEPRKIR